MPPFPPQGAFMRKLLLPIAVAACCTGIATGCAEKPQPRQATHAPAPSRTQLPAKFVSDRVILTPTTDDGQTLELLTDSGGGMDRLSAAAVARLHLSTEPADLPGLERELGEAAKSTRLARLPAFAAGKGIPGVQFLEGRLMVFPEAVVEKQSLPGMAQYDGSLGSRWFADRVWTWDYPGQRFFREAGDYRPEPGAASLPLGFATNLFGKRVFSMPRMTITVDGRQLSMLLDTGASTMLTPAALDALDDGEPAERATSMISDDVFQAWRKAHPHWRVIEHAQAGSGSAMIEVPQLDIAGFTVGPVWFTHRPNANFHDMMSSMMDEQVEGAVGGNAFHHFVMTVDYPEAIAYFRCVVDCGPAAAPGQAPTPPPAP